MDSLDACFAHTAIIAQFRKKRDANGMVRASFCMTDDPTACVYTLTVQLTKDNVLTQFRQKDGVLVDMCFASDPPQCSEADNVQLWRAHAVALEAIATYTGRKRVGIDVRPRETGCA